MIIYISGAILNDFNYMQKFKKAEDKLTEMGHIAINPCWIKSGLTHEQHMHIDLAILEGVYAIFQKLAAYEDTGLEPEEMKKGYEAMKNAYDVCIEREELHAEIQEQIREYRKLEEQGLLIKLPCKVGNMVWSIDNTPWRSKFDYWMIPMWNKEFFLTREEAEKALLN